MNETGNISSSAVLGFLDRGAQVRAQLVGLMCDVNDREMLEVHADDAGTA